MAHTLLADVAHRYHVEMGITHPLCEWAIRLCAWLHATHAVNGTDKQTAFQRRYGRQYLHSTVPFGETLLWKSALAHQLKLKSSFGQGIWLGRSWQNNCHLIGTASGSWQSGLYADSPPTSSTTRCC